MRVKNVSPLGDLELPLVGRVIARGEVFDVPDEDGEVLILQANNWLKMPKLPSKPKAGDRK